MPDTTPIACTLAPGEYIDRLKWVADLTKDALRGRERHDLELTLGFAPEAVDRVRELVRREQACCGFLTFELDESPKEIRLTIRASEEARLAADMIFANIARPGAITAVAAASIRIWRLIARVLAKS